MERRRTLPESRASWVPFRWAMPLGLALACAAGGFPGVARAQDDPAPDLERGEVVFELCAQCHGGDGMGRELFRAPAIAGLAAWYIEAQVTKFRSGARGRHFDDLEGLRMRPMALVLEDDADIPAVAAYVESLPERTPESTLEGGDPTRGAQLYATCAACHGPDGRGNQALSAPSLVATDDWYQLRQLRKFREGIRGSDPADTQGIMMAPMAMQLPDEQAVLDVLAHVRTLAQ